MAKDMSGSRAEASIFARLMKAQVGCSLNNEQKFLPLDILEKEITEDNVRSALSKDTGLSATALKLFRISSDDQLPRRVVEQARKVFAVLLLVGEPNAIRKLLAEGLTDDQLPLHLDDHGNPPTSPSGKVFRSFTTLMTEHRISDFVDKQWIVLAPPLDASGRHITLGRRCPLPFEKTDQTGHGPTSAVYKSKLHPAHYRGPELFSNMEYVATKEFWDENAFGQETDNLKTLASLNHDHLIKHLATFTRNAKHYVIFPWADGGTLADFWVQEDTLVKDKDLILWCFRQILGVSKAVQALHSVNCRHGDMKPENILHFNGPDRGSLVVADVGVSRSHDKATLMRQGTGTQTRATTPSYEAPEAFASQYTPRARRYDMWSMGCIFLEFALWILHDMKSIDSFHDARHAPYFEFYLLHRDSSASKRRPEIHPIVTKAFELLRKDLRCSGTIFEEFLDLIEHRLLKVEVDQRAEADELVERLTVIVEDANANPERLLKDIDPPPDKLRFPKRTQTGAFEPVNGAIPEQHSL